ncbi:hypothetical protein EDD15DRAFT_2361155 [Pisolithus albus]|nr:hypothetical protein EDD15DRAFT_2376270 [Pisolithus albus]KAI6001848.1 hypothetical protein EDD15DRAFT_2361155 [Pisolithus albus]
MNPTHRRQDFTPALSSAEGSDDPESSDSSSASEAEELKRIRAAIAPRAENANPREVREALEEAQNLLLQMRTKLQTLESRNALLEAQKGKGRRGKKVGNLSNKELSVALKEEAIRTHGRKYSATHCLWINTEIFPLRKNPEINLFAAERWVSPLAIEDGVKTELFKYIPKEDQSLMAHKDFGEAFSHGVQSLRSEMVSDIKSMAGAVFGLPADFFLRSCNRFEELRCRQLLLSPTGKYTKFAPCLFPDPDNLKSIDFLKTALLVRAIRAAFFGKSSVGGGTNAPGPKCKAKLWGLRDTSAGLIAGAAVVTIFILSGDMSLNTKGDKTQIPYLEWHNYYRSCLLKGDAWSRSVFKFFNNSLFPASSKDDATVQIEADDWELAYQNAFEAGVELPAVITTQSASAPFPPREPAPSLSHPVTPPAVTPSISAALEDLTLDNELVPPPPGPSEAAGEHELGEAPGAKGKIRGKVKRKGKATAVTVDEVGLDDESSSAVSNARRTRRGRGQA